MSLIPESISNTSTETIDSVWKERLELLRMEQLHIDLEHETDQQKLELWMEMFGVDLNMIPNSLTTIEYQRLLQSIILIYRLSGTPKSMQLLGYVLGATEVNVKRDFVLRYDGSANYNGHWQYDSGQNHQPFIVKLEVSGIAEANQLTFIEKLKQLFDLFEPVWVWLAGVIFGSQVYNSSGIWDFNLDMIGLDFNQEDVIDLNFE